MRSLQLTQLTRGIGRGIDLAKPNIRSFAEGVGSWETASEMQVAPRIFLMADVVV